MLANDKILTLLIAVLPACTALSARPMNMLRTTFEAPPRCEAAPGTPDFERAVDRVTRTRLTDGNRVRLLTNGDEAFPAMLAAIRGAEERISMESFILRMDATGTDFVEALTAAALRGVEVRFVTDALGNRALESEDLAGLRAAGAEVRIMNPLLGWTIVRVNNRNHRKILVVDGRVAFMGGLNLSDDYAGDGFTGWRDTAVRVEGPAAHEAERIFAESFAQAGRGWVDRDLPLVGFAPIKRLLDLPFRPFVRRPFSPPEPPPAAADTVHGNARVRAVATAPDRVCSRLLDMHLLAIHSARERVYISSAYFVPPELLMDALTEAADRGVDVRMLLPGTTDEPIVPDLCRRTFGKLLAHGVGVYEWPREILHTKTIVVDGKWASIGSCNLNSRGLFLNYEANFAISDAALAEAMERQFERDLEHARPVDLEEWCNRPCRQKAREFFFNFLRDQS